MEPSEHKIGITLAFLGGLGVSFTGCIYPLIPVLLGSLGRYIQKKKIKGFILGFVYVSGFAFIYSIMGITASFTGSVFGRILTYPITRIVAGFIFIIFGLSFLDIFSLRTVSFKPRSMSFDNPYLKLFFMGLTSGLVISPCVSPVLGSILLYVALKKDLFYGWLLLLSFAYGLGFLLILCATFGGLLLSLPKPGEWMEKIKKTGAFILILTGVYFIVATLMGRF